MPLPTWVTDPSLDDDERAKRTLNYRLRQAALHLSPDGSLTHLSESAGFGSTYLRNCINRGRLPRSGILAIQSLVGFEVFNESMLSLQ